MASTSDRPTSDWDEGFLYDLLEQLKRSVTDELVELRPGFQLVLTAAVTTIPVPERVAATVSLDRQGPPSSARATVWSDGIWFGVVLPGGLDVRHVDEPLGDDFGSPETAEYNRSIFRAYADVAISFLSGRWERAVCRRALLWTETCRIQTFGHGVVTLKGFAVRSRPRSLNTQAGPCFEGM